MKHFLSKISRLPGPFIIAACAAIPVVYLSFPVIRLCLFVLSCFLLAASFVLCILHYPVYVRISLAAACGLIAGFISVSGIEQFSPGLPTEKITAIQGKLLDDPRSFGTDEERGMALLALTESCTSPGRMAGSSSATVRASAQGRALVFFPAGTMPRLRSFGRGAELYLEGNFLPDNAAAGTASSPSGFRAASVHIIKPSSAPEQIRTAVRSAVFSALKPKPWGALAAALLIGTRENLEGDLANSFRNAGLSHILALSGMHLAFLSAMLAFILEKPLGKKGSVIAGFVFIVLYVFLVGPQPSLVRAVIMYGLGSFLFLSGTTKQSFALLSAAFLIQILFDPLSAYSISFILSYLALAGILVLSGPILILLRGRLPPSLALGVSASMGAFLVTSPVTAIFFGILRPVGIIAGLVAVPLSGIFMGFSLLWLLAGKAPFIGFILDKLLFVLHFFLSRSISLFARLPGFIPALPAVFIGIPLLIAGLLILGEWQARYRNELAPFA